VDGGGYCSESKKGEVNGGEDRKTLASIRRMRGEERKSSLTKTKARRNRFRVKNGRKHKSLEEPGSGGISTRKSGKETRTIQIAGQKKGKVSAVSPSTEGPGLNGVLHAGTIYREKRGGRAPSGGDALGSTERRGEMPGKKTIGVLRRRKSTHTKPRRFSSLRGGVLSRLRRGLGGQKKLTRRGLTRLQNSQSIWDCPLFSGWGKDSGTSRCGRK